MLALGWSRRLFCTLVAGIRAGAMFLAIPLAVTSAHAQTTVTEYPILELPPLLPRAEIEATAPPLRVPVPPIEVDVPRSETAPPPVAAPSESNTPVLHSLRHSAGSNVCRTCNVSQLGAGGRLVPISFDAVLCLARDQNGQVRIAREKLQEAYVEQELTGKRWLPEISVGAGYWRHDGGIQDFYGNLIKSTYGGVLPGVEVQGKFDIREHVIQRLESERRIWQQQGELSRFSSDQLLDAASTYMDLLAARTAEAIGIEAETKLERLLKQAKDLETVDPGVRVEVTRVEAELGAQKILTRRVREGARSAVAKLIYLLGLDPTSELVVQETQMTPLRLVEANQPSKDLLDVALQRGPGVQELQAILGLLEDMRAKGQSPLHWLPTVQVTLGEGALGAMPGPQTDWANRWELGVQARWNVTELLTGRQRQRLADLKIQQAYLNYQDMRGKLTLGVQEAYEAVHSAKEQMEFAAVQIQHAEESYNLSDMRLRENIKGRSPSEVLLAIRALVGARLSYLHALRDLDKAQIRLFVLTGAAAANCPR
jgi:outer membrane protein TolC